MITYPIAKREQRPRAVPLPNLPSVLVENGNRILQREEAWGSVRYDYSSDLFSADIRDHEAALKPASPLGIYWLIMAPCNLRCVHCYGNVEEFPKESLSTEDQFIIADRIIESGAMRVTIAGGEPLLRKDTPAIIEKLADNNISVILGTNGTYLRPEIMSSVKRTTLVEISLDSQIEQINNAIRISRTKTGNAFKEALQAIDLCIKEATNLRVLTCLNKYNYKNLQGLADLVYAHGVRDWGLSWTVYAGRAKAIYADHMPKDMDVVVEQIQEIRNKYPDLKIKYSNRTDQSSNNRFSFLIFPNGRAFAEDLVLGQKFAFHSLLDAPLIHSWTDENYNIEQHFKRWTGNRVRYTSGGLHV